MRPPTFEKAMFVTCAGFRVKEIGGVVEREVRKNGFSVIYELGGHGIGRSIHEKPFVANFPAAGEGTVITDRGPGNKNVSRHRS